MKNKIIYLFFTLLLLIGVVSALPGIPHQFYGDVLVNGVAANDNNIITAVIEGDVYTTVTTNGKYGIAPNIFYIEDPEGNREGEVTFYLGGENGKEVGTYTFANNGFTEFNIDTTTVCGDGYCIGDETCDNCENDCGECTEPPVITISSPENKVYDTDKIDLKVVSDQTILIWMYSLNDADPITFTPDITLTIPVDENGSSENTIKVIGINKNFQSGNRQIAFQVQLPVGFCGDLTCDPSIGEDCGNCPADCGACAPPNNNNNGGGGNSGGGSSGSSKKVVTDPVTNQTYTEFTNLNTELEEENTEEGDENTGQDETMIEEDTGSNFLSGITGAVTALTGRIGRTRSILAIVLVIVIVGVIIFASQGKSKKGIEE